MIEPLNTPKATDVSVDTNEGKVYITDSKSNQHTVCTDGTIIIPQGEILNVDVDFDLAEEITVGAERVKLKLEETMHDIGDPSDGTTLLRFEFLGPLHAPPASAPTGCALYEVELQFMLENRGVLIQ
jgi:hypothetical protein